MDKEEAINLALKEMRKFNEHAPISKIDAYYEKRHMSKGKGKSGWVITVSLDSPGIDPAQSLFEVYENSNEVILISGH